MILIEPSSRISRSADKATRSSCPIYLTISLFPELLPNPIHLLQKESHILGLHTRRDSMSQVYNPPLQPALHLPPPHHTLQHPPHLPRNRLPSAVQHARI